MALAKIIAQNLNAIGGPFFAAPLGGGPACHIPGFHVPLQEQTNWCWAAVAVGVAARYGAVWQQCNLAGLELGQQCCPAGTNPGACNVPYYLDRALARVGHFRAMVAGAAPLNPQVIAEINANRPVGGAPRGRGGRQRHARARRVYPQGRGDPHKRDQGADSPRSSRWDYQTISRAKWAHSLCFGGLL